MLKSMLYFTKYANNKFDILNKHEVYFRREEVEDAVSAPDNLRKSGKNYFAHKDRVGVVYEKDGEEIKIITFYPIK